MWNRFEIRRGDKVLDVGCGAWPFIFATHLADVSLKDNSKRFGGAVPPTHLPFFECSVEAMPFGNSEFDFVYCAQVLEHVADPARACRELMRVGKRGYIECPRSWVEYAFHSVDHRWLVDQERNCLIFREKLDAEKRDFLGIQYSIFSWLKFRRFRRYWNDPQMRAIRNVEFYWEGKFNLLVISKEDRINAGKLEQFYGSSSVTGTSKGSPVRRMDREVAQQFIYSELQRSLKNDNANVTANVRRD